ncbi:MAG: hypothetical protein Alis3KO_25830 [Aliiglaciecola sp.]
MLNLFFPYYQCGDKERQTEIDLCLTKNIENELVTKLFVLVDDGSTVPFSDKKIEVLSIESRPTYKKWIELTRKFSLEGISILCNSDIYFDETIRIFEKVLRSPEQFVALSRWEVAKNKSTLHPNPHWSQDVWAINCNNSFSPEMLHQLDFQMGVPRCDNKIAYLFGIFGWQVFNPCALIKSYHVHETELRTYNKKLDLRILGGVAYVHPTDDIEVPSKLDVDVWVNSSKNINSIKLNKSLEKWRAEIAAESREIQCLEPTAATFSKCSAGEMIEAIRRGESIVRMGSNFELLQLGEYYIFKNGYSLLNPVKIKVSEATGLTTKQLFAAGSIPPVIGTYCEEIGEKANSANDLLFWQYPCATEKQAYENNLEIASGKNANFITNCIHTYLPLPWATFIDRKGFPSSYLNKLKTLILQYKKIAHQANLQLKVHTVCQHIHWRIILEVASDLGVTDLHLSHKDSNSENTQQELGFQLNLRAWPLIAVNYVIEDRREGMERKEVNQKNLLASFIGAHMRHYMNDSRIKLFEAAKSSGREDVFVDLGEEWHFNKVVYEEQVLNKEIESHHIDEHHKKTFRYNSILSDSKFSLCPIGAGPNTLRFWESISVGSIPVLFSDDLAIFEEFDTGVELLESCVVWSGKITPSLFDHLATYDVDELKARSDKLQALFGKYNNQNILDYIQGEPKTNEELNILYLGASVTAQKNGYRPELNKMFEDTGFMVKEKVLATGATGSMFGLSNLSTLPKVKNKFDIAFYEYSTGDLNRGLTPENEIFSVVSESLSYLKSIAKRVYLIHNYRRDYEGTDGDFIRLKYNDAAKEQSIQIIDNTDYFEKLRLKIDEKDWPTYYRDNVHTGERGSQEVAKLIFDQLDGINSLTEASSQPVEQHILSARFHPLSLNHSNTGSYTYPSSKQVFNYHTIQMNESLTFSCKGEFWGMVSIVGPSSGWVEVKADGVIIQKFCQLDAHCYYERVQPRQFIRNFENDTKIEIRLVQGELDFAKVKHEHQQHSGERLLKLSLIMGRNLMIENAVVLNAGEQL